jgi:hypothetical protein
VFPARYELNLYILVLFRINSVFIGLNCVESNGRPMGYAEMEIMWVNVVVAYFKVLLQHFLKVRQNNVHRIAV